MNAAAITKTLPSAEDIELARESGRTLSTALLMRSKTPQIDFHECNGDIRSVHIPTSALQLRLEVLTEIGRGNAVSIVPIHAALTAQESADILNVSLPSLVQLLENGDMPFHNIGMHRRLRYQDVI